MSWRGQQRQQAAALDVGRVLDDEDIVTTGRRPDPDTGACAPVLKRIEALPPDPLAAPAILGDPDGQRPLPTNPSIKSRSVEATFVGSYLVPIG